MQGLNALLRHPEKHQNITEAQPGKLASELFVLCRCYVHTDFTDL